MFHIRGGESARNNSFLEDAIRLFNQPRPDKFLQRSLVRYYDIAHLCVSSTCPFDESVDQGKIRRVRFEIKKSLVARAELSDVLEESCCPIAVLPVAVSDYLGLQLNADDMSYILRHVSPKGVKRSSAGVVLLQDHPGASSSSNCPNAPDAVMEIDERYARYAKYSQDELVACIIEREDTNEVLREEKRAIELQANYYKTQCAELQRRCGESQRQQKLFEAQVNYRPGLRCISRVGGYSIALKRNLGHTGSRAAIVMLAGDAIQGGFQNKNTVTRYEELSCACQRELSRSDYDMIDASMSSSENGFVECIAMEGDATNQEAIGKNKCHISVVSLLAAKFPAVGDSVNDVGSDSMKTYSLADIQVVVESSAAETFLIFEKELQSVGAPTWRERKEQAADNPGRFSIFQCVVDAGPDNTGMARRIRACLENCDNVFFCIVFCFMHQLQLCIKTLVETLDGFSFDAASLPCKYFSSVAIIANVWRGPNMKSQLLNAAVGLPGMTESLAQRLFGRLPGRCLRGRWGSIDSVEEILVRCGEWLGLALSAALKRILIRDKPQLKSDKGIDVDEIASYKAKQRTYRLNAIACSTSPFWRVMVLISHRVKAPFIRCLNVCQKNEENFNIAVGEAVKRGENYMGPTPLSMFVTTLADSIMQSIVALTSATAMTDKDLWGGVWAMLPQESFPNAACLILTCVLRAAASWQMRAMNQVATFPLLFLQLVQASADKVDPRRTAICELLLAMPLCCLRNCPYSDFAAKVKTKFLGEFTEMRDTGTCPKRLYVFLLAWRSMARFSSQHCEGWMSLLQHMTKRATRMEQALANARMSIKVGYPIEARDCVTVDGLVRERIKNGDDKFRFSPVVVTDDMRTAPPRHKRCSHARSELEVVAASYASSAYSQLTQGASMVTRFECHIALRNCACILGWSHKTQLWVAPGVLSPSGIFELSEPLVMQPLETFLVTKRMLREDDVHMNAPREHFYMTAIQYRYTMIQEGQPTIMRGIVDTTVAKRYVLKWAPPANVDPSDGLTDSEDDESKGLDAADSEDDVDPPDVFPGEPMPSLPGCPSSQDRQGYFDLF